MDIIFGIFVFLAYVAVFVLMIFAAAIHNWFAFSGWFFAWLFAVALAIAMARN